MEVIFIRYRILKAGVFLKVWRKRMGTYIAIKMRVLQKLPRGWVILVMYAEAWNFPAEKKNSKLQIFNSHRHIPGPYFNLHPSSLT